MDLRFTKMHGLGNDFVVIDAITRPVPLTAEQVRRIADRHRGVGCDQVLLVEPSNEPGVDFVYRILNADGGEVEQCGNGARCVGRFVHDRGLVDRRDLVARTRGGRIRIQVGLPDDTVAVDMGEPRFDPAAIPFTADREAPEYRLDTERGPVTVGAVSMGNPHAVLRVDRVADAPVAELGPVLERHPRFPARTNVGFVELVAPDAVRLRVFERGVGETQACGTGACAAVAVGRDRGWLADSVAVTLPGGRLRIDWPGRGHPLWMTGAAEYVFEGQIRL